LLRELYPLLVAMAAAAVVYALRELRRQRMQVNPQMPEVLIREAWELWQAGQPERVPAHLHAALEADLLATEARCLESGAGRLALRRAILESATMALHLETISQYGETERKALLGGYEEGMDTLLGDALTAATLKWTVLRHYGHLKYDDATAQDWFEHFTDVAKPYIREKVRLAREFVLERDEGAGRFVARYDALLAELGDAMLKAPPKKRYVPEFDK
jgi:hypothetical protein